MYFFRFLLISVLVLFKTGCAQAETQKNDHDILKAMQQDSIIEFLSDKPYLIRAAINAYETRLTKNILTEFHEQIFQDSRDISIGPDTAKVTIVEFFDYNCSYCKRSADWVKQTIEHYPQDVQIIFKELPILENRTQTSRHAAKVALAAAKQDKYPDIHFALMKEASLNTARINDIAREHNLDMAQLTLDMETDLLNSHLQDTMNLAQQIPTLTGTPFFIINSQFVNGGDTQRLQTLLLQELSD